MKDLFVVNRDLMALAICAQGRPDEAERLGLLAREEAGDHGDFISQWGWRRILGNVAAARGELDDAERLLRDAVGYAVQTDSSFERAYNDMDLANVLRRAGRSVDAIPLLEEAVRLCELKEDVVTAGIARERLVTVTSKGDTSA